MNRKDSIEFIKQTERMMINSENVKITARKLGADLCGIASVESFVNAPEGFHPRDVLPECKSIIVIARRFLKSTLYASSTIPYTDVRNFLTREMDNLAINLSYNLESKDNRVIPINAIGPTEWDSKTQKKRGIISLKHSAELAGLGKIGKNTLLVNDKYGNMIWLSAVITSDELKPDPVASYDPCRSDCNICLKSCPVKALDGVTIDQKKCWEYAFGTYNGGGWRIKCFLCRKLCPNCLKFEDRK